MFEKVQIAGPRSETGGVLALAHTVLDVLTNRMLTHSLTESSLDESGLSLHVWRKFTHSREVHLLSLASLPPPGSGPQAGRRLLGLWVWRRPTGDSTCPSLFQEDL